MYVKLSWRPEVDRKLSYNGCTVSNFDLPQIAFWPWTEGQRRYQRGGKGAKGLYC
jgi:hypothetical protein